MLYKMIRFVLFIFIFSFMFSAPCAAQAEDNPVRFIEVTGEADISGTSVDIAREKAIQSALHVAIGEGAGMVLDASSIVTDDELLEKIYTHSRGAVSEYDVIESEQTKTGIYRVRLSVGIQTGKLENSLAELGLLNTMMSSPRIMIIQESGQDPDVQNNPAQYHLMSYFTEKKFDVVDTNAAANIQSIYQDLKASGNMKGAISRFGIDHHAEIVILYSVETSASTYDGIMENVPAVVKARAISTTTAQVMGAGQVRANGIGVTPEAAKKDGIHKAAQEIAVKLSNDLASWWRNYTANGIPYIITLRAPEQSTELFIEFQKTVTGIQGVVSLTDRGSLNGITEMMVKYRFGMAELKSEIIGALCKKPGFKSLEIVQSKGRFMIFALK